MKLIISFLLLAMSVVAQEVKLVEQLPDQTLIIEYRGEEYRALTADSMRTVLQTRNERDELRLDREKLMKAVTELRDLTEREKLAYEGIIDNLTKKGTAEVSFWKGEYESEKALRIEYEDKLKRCTRKIILFRLCW